MRATLIGQELIVRETIGPRILSAPIRTLAPPFHSTAAERTASTRHPPAGFGGLGPGAFAGFALPPHGHGPEKPPKPWTLLPLPASSHRFRLPPRALRTDPHPRLAPGETRITCFRSRSGCDRVADKFTQAALYK